MGEGGREKPVSSPCWVRLQGSLGCEKIRGHRVMESGSFTQPTFEKLPMGPSLPAKTLSSLSF